jgi:hypothetical protein
MRMMTDHDVRLRAVLTPREAEQKVFWFFFSKKELLLHVVRLSVRRKNLSADYAD